MVHCEALCVGLAAHNLHSDTPARHSGPLAAHLVDLAALLYTVGLQITYQRLSAQVRNIRDMRTGITRLNVSIAEADRRASAAADAAAEIFATRSPPAASDSGTLAEVVAAAAEAGGDVGAAVAPAAAAPNRSSSQSLRETRAKAIADIEAEIRLLDWHQRAAVHGGWKSAAVLQASLYLAHVLRQIQQRAPNVWSHVPEMYVEFAVCAHHALQRHTKRPLQPATRHVALLLSRLLGDPRVVTPTMRDVVLQSVTNLLVSSAPLSAVADDDEVMGHLLPGVILSDLMCVDAVEHSCMWRSLTALVNSRSQYLCDCVTTELIRFPSDWQAFCLLKLKPWHSLARACLQLSAPRHHRLCEIRHRRQTTGSLWVVLFYIVATRRCTAM